MPSLRELQTLVMNGLLAEQPHGAAALIRPGGILPESRLRIYQNNARSNFAEALRSCGQDTHSIRIISRCLAHPDRRFEDADELEEAMRDTDLLTNSGTTKVDDLVEVIYADVIPELHPAARRTVHAHLLKLAKEGKAKGRSIDGKWSAAV